MLPDSYSEGDRQWLEERFEELSRLTGINNSKAVAERYSISYIEAMENEQTPHKKENKARHEANSRLLKLINKIKSKPVQPK